MMSSMGLPPSVLSQLRGVFARYPQIEKVLVYGSRAKGNFRPGSDIDLSLIAPSLSLTDLLRMETEIDDLLLPYKVDLSLFHQIENPDLREHILRVGIELK